MMSRFPEWPVHTFETEGMNTTFVLRIRHADQKRAHSLAGNCFRLLEELEDQLSRYRVGSDISRINQLEAGEALSLTDAAYRCLIASMEAYRTTQGLFDVTMGLHSQGKLSLDPDHPRIFCEEKGRQVDLGGIGKGFALDELARVLTDLEVESALLSAGGSTHLALGAGSWPMDLRGDREIRRVELQGQALSSSGTHIQGAHVLHPDSVSAPRYRFKRVWVVAGSGAMADAFSTACLLMDEAELAAFVNSQQGRVTVHGELADAGSLLRFETVC